MNVVKNFRVGVIYLLDNINIVCLIIMFQVFFLLTVNVGLGVSDNNNMMVLRGS